MTEEIVWEDPPVDKATRGGTGWADKLRPLLDHPTKWARIAERDSSAASANTASNLRHRKVIYAAGNFEFVARTVHGKHYVYARYLGPKDKPND